ncbi:MAG TPA: bifunctional phosphopantothenoylcysteine decarboxylase/phosphopantothenate--cysteine ligase CoaBC [Bacteroidota bacterium]|nr:bifunctional phosphopantothenoylcysteine decarboxylase/phosphopantothenate--cysteine ligase CoaBC [Bacteroidota bacterium]
MMSGKRILLGVTGGIAAYKSAFLVRELVRAGAEVQVVMTKAACEFITPLTMGTLSRRDAAVDMFPPRTDGPAPLPLRHIELALWGDVMVIAPATANTIAKIVHGTADNLLTTLVLALRSPLVVAPAMDVDMYLNETTGANIAALREAGCTVIEPDEGELASGLTGPGRMADVARVIAVLDGVLANAAQDFEGRRILVTAGPTEEPIDPVRFISNRSSGKMGFAVAAAAAMRGARVTLVSGPVSLRTPRNVRRIDVRTAAEMAAAVTAEFTGTDLLVMAAAVADFAPVRQAAQKLKRGEAAGRNLVLELAENPDILKGVGAAKTRQVIVGFALETENGEENARRKLAAKHLDLIVLNNPLEEGAAIGGDTNVVTVIGTPGNAERLPRMAKIDVAHALLTRALPLLG